MHNRLQEATVIFFMSLRPHLPGRLPVGGFSLNFISYIFFNLSTHSYFG